MEFFSANAKVMNYVGWVGHGNVGDEALYAAIQKILDPYKLIPCGNSLSGVSTPLYSGITLFGGGTLLPRWASSIMPNRFNYAYGVGVVDPSFYRYQYGARAMKTYKFAIEKTRKIGFRLIGVRGERSRRLLHGWGIESKTIGDPCLLLTPSKSQKKEENLIALNVGSSECYEPVWGRSEDLVKEVTKLCLSLKKDGYLLVLVPFGDIDMTHIHKISNETGLPIFKKYHNVRLLIDFISSCHLLIGERLHSTVFSAAAFTPFLSIVYHPKSQEFSESVGFQKYTLRVDNATAKNVEATFHDLMNNWDGMQDILKEKVETYRKRLASFASRIKMDIESLPNTKWLPPEARKRAIFKVACTIKLHLPTIFAYLETISTNNFRNL